MYTVIDTFTDSANAVMDQITSVFREQQYARSAAMSWVYFLIIGVILGIILLISARSNRNHAG